MIGADHPPPIARARAGARALLLGSVALTLTFSGAASAQGAQSASPPMHPLAEWAVTTLKDWRAALDPEWLIAAHPSASVGRAGHGRLLFPVQMPSSPGIHVRDADDAWTVPEVIVGLQAAHAAVVARHLSGPDMVIGDISRRNGGRFPPHRSHQDGRDVDMRYFQTGKQHPDYKYRMVGPQNFDVPRNWTLLKFFYDSGMVDRVFVDYRHQRALYRYARRTLKMSKDDLEPILSYPRGRYRPDALVRHVRNHYGHLHVRFKAPLAKLAGTMWSRREAADFQRRVDLARRGQFHYVVRRGDTLGHIAEVNAVTVANLRSWNRLPRRATLRPGQVIKVLRTN